MGGGNKEAVVVYYVAILVSEQGHHVLSESWCLKSEEDNLPDSTPFFSASAHLRLELSFFCSVKWHLNVSLRMCEKRKPDGA